MATHCVKLASFSQYDFVVTAYNNDEDSGALPNTFPPLAWSSYYILGIGLTCVSMFGFFGNLYAFTASLLQSNSTTYNHQILRALLLNNAMHCAISMVLLMPNLIKPTSLTIVGPYDEPIPIDSLLPCDVFVTVHKYVYPFANIISQASSWLSMTIIVERRITFYNTMNANTKHAASVGAIIRRRLSDMVVRIHKPRNHYFVVFGVYVVSVLLTLPAAFEYEYRPVAVSPLQAVVVRPFNSAKISLQQFVVQDPQKPLSQRPTNISNVVSPERYLLDHFHQGIIETDASNNKTDLLVQCNALEFQSGDGFYDNFTTSSENKSNTSSQSPIRVDMDCDFPTVSKMAIVFREWAIKFKFRAYYRWFNNVLIQGIIPICVAVGYAGSLIAALGRNGQHNEDDDDSTDAISDHVIRGKRVPWFFRGKTPQLQYTMAAACHALFALMICTLPSVWAEVSLLSQNGGSLYKQAEDAARLWLEISNLIFGFSAAFSWLFYVFIINSFKLLPRCCYRCCHNCCLTISSRRRRRNITVTFKQPQTPASDQFESSFYSPVSFSFKASYFLSGHDFDHNIGYDLTTADVIGYRTMSSVPAEGNNYFVSDASAGNENESAFSLSSLYSQNNGAESANSSSATVINDDDSPSFFAAYPSSYLSITV